MFLLGAPWAGGSEKFSADDFELWPEVAPGCIPEAEHVPRLVAGACIFRS